MVKHSVWLENFQGVSEKQLSLART